MPPRLGKAIAISIKEAFSTYIPTKEFVLVGTYRDENQLHMTLTNKLYYVRAGLRAGAMQFPSGMKAPHYLFLHKKDNFVLLTSKEKEPWLVSREYLVDLGFHPSGDLYWAIEVDDIETEERTKNFKSFVDRHGGMKMKPYILEI